MTTDRDKCGLGSILPMSCRGRAEAFARRLHSRLTSLGSQDGNGAADESSWLAAHENPIAISQPRHNSDSELYFDLGVLESPGSPEDEIEETELHKLINKDNLKLSHSEDCHCPKSNETNFPLINGVKGTSNDSDSSDGPFYDSENDTAPNSNITNHVNGNAQIIDENDTDSDTKDEGIKSDITSQTQDEVYVTSSDCTQAPNSPTISDACSTLSPTNLKEDELEFSSLELNETLPELPQCDESPIIISSAVVESGTDTQLDAVCDKKQETETYLSCLNVDHDLTVECPNAIVIQMPAQIEKVEIQIQEAKTEDGGGDDDDDDNDDDDEVELRGRIPRVRRCTSLKTGKTPPGTPGRKKFVRFADALGLDLADVRTFLDEVPKVPTSAYEDLKDVDLLTESESDMSLDLAHKFHGIKVDKVLVPLFQQPGGLVNFLDKVRDHYVSLDNALVEDPISLEIKGSVRVRNLDFHKSVHIRYSLDSWQTYADVQGVYVENSCDGFSDKFTFIIYAHTLTVGQRLEFAVRFQCKGCQYWDNNNGANYCFQCLPATNNNTYAPITGMDDGWGASFYYQEESSSESPELDTTSSLTTTTSSSSSPATTTQNATQKAVQEFIMHSLQMKSELPTTPSTTTRSDMIAVIVIVIFSFLFVFIQKAIYFTK